MDRQSGFTLVELTVIIALLSILAIAAYPKMVDLTTIRTDMAARRMRSDIRYAQSLAINIQTNTRIDFDEDADNYSLYIEDKDNPGYWARAIDPLTKDNFTVQLNNGDFADVDILAVYFDTDDTDLLFDKWGNPYSYDDISAKPPSVMPLSGTGNVELTGPRYIRVTTGTGRVYLE